MKDISQYQKKELFVEKIIHAICETLSPELIYRMKNFNMNKKYVVNTSVTGNFSLFYAL